MIESQLEAGADRPRINLLGAPSLWLGGENRCFATRERTLSLLAYLALHPGPQQRDRVAFEILPDEDEHIARSSMRQQLLFLARLPSLRAMQWITADFRTVSWSLTSDVDCDVRIFERADAKDAHLACELYTGDFLPNVDAEWLIPHRDRLREKYVSLMMALARVRFESARYVESETLLKRVLTNDPWCEEALRLLLEAKAARGDRSGALEQFRLFRARMAAELGAEPSPVTVRVAGTIAAGEFRLEQRAVLTPSNAPKTNLPHSINSLIGRELDVSKILALLDEHRLTTIVGSGGVGKTRVALEVGHQVNQFADGAWLVELARVQAAEHVPSAIAQSLNVISNAAAGTEPLVGYLRSKRLLLILDNCEHLVQAAADMASTILRNCPNVAILATSRQRLGIAGEETYRLPSLTVSNPNAGMLRADEANGLSAVRLFVERAMGSSKSFRLNDENASIIADICRRLDGIPLAIELAASRVNVLGLEDLQASLEHRFAILTGGSRDALPRHRTLRALIDWSYDLLDEHERLAFRRLSIFVDGFTLDGAVAVAAEDGLARSDLISLLASLVDKSLLVVDTSGTALRYAMLDSTRAYGLERLSLAGDRISASRRHLSYLRTAFKELSQRTEESAVEFIMSDAFSRELADVRAALACSLASDDADDCIEGAALLAHTNVGWRNLGLQNEWAKLAQNFYAALPRESASLRSEIGAILCMLISDADRQHELAESAVRDARRSGEKRVLAKALEKSAELRVHYGQVVEADPLLAQAEAIPGVSALQSSHLCGLRALLESMKGNLDSAAHLFDELRRQHAALGNTRMAHVFSLHLSNVEHKRGHTTRAIALMQAILPEARASSDTYVASWVLCNLADYLGSAGDTAGAEAAALESVRIHAESDINDTMLALTLEQLALAWATRGEIAGAAVLTGYIDACFKRSGLTRLADDAIAYHRACTILDDNLPAAERTWLEAEGAGFTKEAIIAYSLARRNDRAIVERVESIS